MDNLETIEEVQKKDNIWMRVICFFIGLNAARTFFLIAAILFGTHSVGIGWLLAIFGLFFFIVPALLIGLALSIGIIVMACKGFCNVNNQAFGKTAMKHAIIILILELLFSSFNATLVFPILYWFAGKCLDQDKTLEEGIKEKWETITK